MLSRPSVRLEAELRLGLCVGMAATGARLRFARRRRRFGLCGARRFGRLGWGFLGVVGISGFGLPGRRRRRAPQLVPLGFTAPAPAAVLLAPPSRPVGGPCSATARASALGGVLAAGRAMPALRAYVRIGRFRRLGGHRRRRRGGRAPAATGPEHRMDHEHDREKQRRCRGQPRPPDRGRAPLRRFLAGAASGARRPLSGGGNSGGSLAGSAAGEPSARPIATAA